jgi:hypothetical protein
VNSAGSVLCFELISGYVDPKIDTFLVMLRVVTRLSPSRCGLKSWPICMGFLMDKVALGQASLEYFGFPPSHYHSTNAPFTFMHVSPMLCNLGY